MITKLNQDVEFFKKQADFNYQRSKQGESTAGGVDGEQFRMLSTQLNDANEHIGDQFKQV